ncbi:MAG TPA: hypothetical protein VGP88_01445 [Thermoplasmata archaeon]|nr:hypothetical protein [Thermoplasmata archaeon]
MRGFRVGVELGLLRAGVDIGRGFGWHSLEEMARIALYLEGEIYEKGSLRAVPGGIAFTLHNPPLRMGAFRLVRLLWDGRPLPEGDCTVHPQDLPGPVRFDQIRRETPLILPAGRQVAFGAQISPPPTGPHTVRLELQSLAIPPVVWFQVTENLRPLPPEPP